MLLWFLGLSVVIVWKVFSDAGIDYRLVMAGALLPDLTDVATGGAWFGHTLLASAALLTAIMVATRGRRLLRRRLLALPIGTFLHLVLDGVWARPEVLWWPAFGTDFPAARLLPPFGLALAAELAGAWAVGWFAWRFGLVDPAPRRTFLRSARFGPGVSGS